MHPLRQTSLVLVLGLALACAREAEPAAAKTTAAEDKAETEKAPDEPRGPTVGAPAPALSLVSLSGQSVQLPAAASERASVLIFGSFS
jgi:hypothetical protein